MNIWFKRLLFIGVLFAYLGALYHFTKDEPTIQDIQKLIELNERKIDELREQNRRLHERLEASNPGHSDTGGEASNPTPVNGSVSNPSSPPSSTIQGGSTSSSPSKSTSPAPPPPPEQPQEPEPEPTVIDRIMEPIQRLIP